MRFTLLGAVSLAALTVGCAATEGDLAYRGSLNNVETDGVVMFDDGESGHAGMLQTTCGLTADGNVEEDVNVTDEDTEVVVDGAGDGGTVLTRTRDEVQIVPVGSYIDYDIQTVSIPTVVDARLTESGVAALTECSVQWVDASGLVDDELNLADLGCTGMDPSFDADRELRKAFVSVNGDVLAVTPDGTTPLVQGDIFAYSATEQGLVAATAGENLVSFVDVDGTARWSVDLEAPVLGVEELGTRGYVAAMVDNGLDSAGEPLGRLVVMNALDGSVLLDRDLPGVADVVASGNGETLAMVLPDGVHFYTLRSLID